MVFITIVPIILYEVHAPMEYPHDTKTTAKLYIGLSTTI
jgi:hypothetical protein